MTSQAWVDMASCIANCERCDRRFMGNGPILPIGPTPNPIMVLLDAPTRLDDRKRKLTLGDDAMVMFERMLASVGLDLRQMFVTNVIHCWPERSVTDRDMLACLPNMRKAVATCDPKIVLSLGAAALKVAADRRKMTVTNSRGKPYICRLGPLHGRWIFPTWHPAALKKNTGAETALRADIVSFSHFYRDMETAGWPEQGVELR